MSWGQTPFSEKPPASDENVVELLERIRQRGPARSKKQPRLSQRHKWRTQVEVDIDESAVGGVRSRRAHVDTIDLSNNGMAFRYNSYVHIGARVTVQLPLPGDPRVEGVVRYCGHLDGRLHRIGVQFVRVIPSE
jgi:hypothetical protein